MKLLNFRINRRCTINKYDNNNISKELIPRVYMNGRKNLIKRSLNNIIDNSIKYANKINIKLI